ARGFHARRALTVSEVDAPGAVQGDRIEGARTRSPRMEIGIIDPRELEIPPRRLLVDVNEPVGVREWKRSEEEPVEQRENRSVRRDRECQRKEQERRRAFLPGERADGEAQI